ncbi:transporter substrate-binding domain-containing protein [Clostridium sp.]|uniref:transporter substrate-binding domain-containing protein n=1 Tax=Clostridium sp. TaxID=1506 RepID=UPI002FCA3524
MKNLKGNKIKKIFTGALVGVMAMGLIGCGGKNEAADKDMLDVIKENGKVVVGLSGDYAPYEFHIKENGEDKLVGFDIDLANAIADDLGVKLEIAEMEFDSLITALPAGKIDLIISGMNPDEKRKQAVDFSEIYYVSEHGILVRAEDTDKYKTVADLAGKKVGAQLGSTQADLAEAKIENVDMQLLSNVNDLILELKTGKIEALIIEAPVGKISIKSNPDLAMAEQIFTDESGGNAVGIKKGSPKLVEEVNKTIKRLMDDGTMDKFISDAIKITDKEVTE